MKVLKLMGTAAVAALLFTSCLGEGNSSFTNSGFGVGAVSEGSYKPVLNTAFGALYSPVASILPDVCYYASFEVDLNSPENANAATNGYYTATISGLTEIVKGGVDYSVTDTTTLVSDKEMVITNMTSGGYIDKYFFLGVAYNARKDQSNSYHLFWNQSTLEETMTKEDGVSTYSLFLRAKRESDGSGSTETSTSDFQAFKIGDVLESVMKKEGNAGADKFNLKINYLSNINEKDSTDLTWKSMKIECATIKPNENK
ncbi:BFO_2992 family lipoprotein [Parabacteroides sp.]